MIPRKNILMSLPKFLTWNLQKNSFSWADLSSAQNKGWWFEICLRLKEGSTKFKQHIFTYARRMKTEGNVFRICSRRCFEPEENIYHILSLYRMYVPCLCFRMLQSQSTFCNKRMFTTIVLTKTNLNGSLYIPLIHIHSKENQETRYHMPSNNGNILENTWVPLQVLPQNLESTYTSLSSLT
jgi:hypothetical protein